MSLVVESCADDEEQVKLSVTTIYLQQGLTSSSSSQTTIISSKSFKKTLENLKISGSLEYSASGSFKIFSAGVSLAASFAYDKLVDSVESSESY